MHLKGYGKNKKQKKKTATTTKANKNTNENTRETVKGVVSNGKLSACIAVAENQIEEMKIPYYCSKLIYIYIINNSYFYFINIVFI